ncbi:SMC-Scp complex subunit ScpB [Peptostreptococcaceae bacterium OttesenSCG-928-C18]|nr:SMC-Scp complex subunit ScpB [Peptostreptococcaceae bacterium OttesenSCG-928-C18]
MQNYKSIIESVLFAWGEPLSFKELAKVLELENKETKKILEELSFDYLNDDRGIELKKFDEYYQLVTKKENNEFIKKIVNKKKPKKLSNPAMEILAIIAYKQPITKLEIEEIRGVKSTSSIDSLMNRDLVKEVGRLDKIGKPILYGTTDEFLRVFSLDSLKKLPKVHEIELYFENEENDED